MPTQRCTSCQIGLKTEEGWSQFKCPRCGGQDIFRCAQCRRKNVVYKCKKCNFEGP